MASSVALPGFNTPAVGFEQPFDMLEACHQRVERSLDLLERLIAHIDANGHDASSRSAASDVLRYFDIAAPHHHEDEERHVFPVVLATSRDADMRETVNRLHADHLRMDELWARLRLVLQSWRDADPAPAVTESDRKLAADFAQSYAAHIPLEENLIYPAAKAVLSADRLAEIGAEMAARRRQ